MIARKTLSQINVGDSFSISRAIGDAEIDAFAALTGDISPLHMSQGFAAARGFRGRVVHGALLIGYFSQIVGVHFPGENALLATADARFLAPALSGDTIEFTVTAEHISEATGLMRAQGFARNEQSGALLVRCVLQIAFTEAQNLGNG